MLGGRHRKERENFKSEPISAKEFAAARFSKSKSSDRTEWRTFAAIDFRRNRLSPQSTLAALRRMSFCGESRCEKFSIITNNECGESRLWRESIVARVLHSFHQLGEPFILSKFRSHALRLRGRGRPPSFARRRVRLN